MQPGETETRGAELIYEAASAVRASTVRASSAPFLPSLEVGSSLASIAITRDGSGARSVPASLR